MTTKQRLKTIGTFFAAFVYVADLCLVAAILAACAFLPALLLIRFACPEPYVRYAWLGFAVAVIVTAWCVLQLVNHAKNGLYITHCARCRYQLRGSTGAHCPDCGHRLNDEQLRHRDSTLTRFLDH